MNNCDDLLRVDCFDFPGSYNCSCKSGFVDEPGTSGGTRCIHVRFIKLIFLCNKSVSAQDMHTLESIHVCAFTNCYAICQYIHVHVLVIDYKIKNLP
jgi:hypothetical protein